VVVERADEEEVADLRLDEVGRFCFPDRAVFAAAELVDGRKGRRWLVDVVEDDRAERLRMTSIGCRGAA